MTEAVLVAQNRKLVEWRVNRFLARNPEGILDRDDLVSVGMMALLLSIRAFDPRRASRLSTYAVRAIDHRLTAATMRARSGNPREAVSLDVIPLEDGERLVDLLDDPGATRDLACAEARLVLQPLLARLSERDRNLVQAHYVRGESLAGIALAAGVSKQTVHFWLGRALKNLRRLAGEGACA